MQSRSELFDRVYGCLVSGLIGDAMGAPAEGKDYDVIAEEFGWIDDFEGAGTDDSAIKQILIEAILASDGYVTADEFAASFLRNKQYLRLFYVPVQNMFHKVESGLALPVYAGLGNQHSSSSAMSISPMGLINACNPRQAAVETFDVAGLIHAGDSGFCRDGACAMAAAIAQAMTPGATVDSVLDAATAYLHETSATVMRERIDTVLAMARKASDYKNFREAFYGGWLGDIKCDSRETVPCALALFYLADGDPTKCVENGANFGRDADTIGTMVGALAGAYRGIKGVKAEWVSRIEASFGKKQAISKDYGIPPIDAPNQIEIAEALVAVVQKRVGVQKACIKAVEALGGQ